MFGIKHSRIAVLLTIFIGLGFQGVSLGNQPVSSPEYDDLGVQYGQELNCLAQNIYHEGRGESSRGQAAIAAVTMNRVRSADFPGTVCEVVWQYKQFSWTLAAPEVLGLDDDRSWKQALVIAQLFLDGAVSTDVGEATHYHSNDVSPYWIADNEPLIRLGNHTFYTL